MFWHLILMSRQKRECTEVTNNSRNSVSNDARVFSCSALPPAASGTALLQLWEEKGGSSRWPWQSFAGACGAAHPKRQLVLAPGTSSRWELPSQGNGDRAVFLRQTPAFLRIRKPRNRSNLKRLHKPAQAQRER